MNYIAFAITNNNKEIMNKKGLTSEQARDLEKQGLANIVKNKSNQSYLSILIKNLFTYFNLIFAILSILLICVNEYNSLSFLPVILANLVIGIFQQMRSKAVLDKLSLLDKSHFIVMRDGKEINLPSDKLVKGDLIKLSVGQQIPADCIIEEGTVLVNESLLTGEADEIEKKFGDELLSGSFIISGSCYAQLTNVGKHSYSAKLMAKAKQIKETKSEMIKDIDRIIFAAGVIIIPIGLILFCQAYFFNKYSIADSITSMVAAIIGMVPEGMYLLTTIALALSSIRLAQNHVLLHDMKSIETLARVDVLCVDKTGTITENVMAVNNFITPDITDENKITQIQRDLSNYIATVNDENATTEALKNFFKDGEKISNAQVTNFTSTTKHSSVTVNGDVYKLGAPEFVLDANLLNKYSQLIESNAKLGNRVLVFIKQNNGECIYCAFICLRNEIRKNAKKIFTFFHEQGVNIKVISGDNPVTVSQVALEAGIKNADKYIDAANLVTDEDYDLAVKQYTVFGRVKPEQKKSIICALKRQGLKVAMTGDGVNDILAMKEADCSISMGSGSDAAREASQVVLMDSDFSHMEQIVSEGRQDINNITRTSTLFLYKNIFSLVLAIFSIISFEAYPLTPPQISLVSLFNIGIPAFLLTLEPNKKKQKGKFITETITKALPAAITSFLAIITLTKFAELFNTNPHEISTANTYLLSVGGFLILWRIVRPANKYRSIMFAICIIGFLFCVNVFNNWFEIEHVSTQNLSLCALFSVAEASVIRWISVIIMNVRKKLEEKQRLNMQNNKT